MSGWPNVAHDLDSAGFTIIAGPIPPRAIAPLAAAYDCAMDTAAPEDIGVGRATTRVHDFVNRGGEFDELYLHRPILDACCHVINAPFKLSTMLARTLRPRTSAQDLHVDFERDGDGWPMVGFIYMVDEFRIANGATRFLPGSHLWRSGAREQSDEVLACGPAGSVIVYNGSVWHGHGPNLTGAPRRSIQGAYIRRDATASIDFRARMHPEALARISDLAKYLLAI